MYSRQSPDLTEHIRQIALDYPRQWEAARKRPDGSRDGAFIRILAYLLNRHVDHRVGLNGKRGGHEESTDALAYQNHSAPGGAEVIDVIIGATHSPAWQDVTIPPAPHPMNDPAHHPPEGVLGRFIFPERHPDVLLHHVHPDDLKPGEGEQEPRPIPPVPPAPLPGPGPSQPPPQGDEDAAEARRVLEEIYGALRNIDGRTRVIEQALAAILTGMGQLKLPVDTIVNLTLLSERLKDTTLLDDIRGVRAQLDRGFKIDNIFSRSPKITPIR